MIFNKAYSGKTYSQYLANATYYSYRSDGYFAGVSMSIDISPDAMTYATLTGWTQVSKKGKTFYQCVSGRYIDLTEGNWQLYDSNPGMYSQSAAQKLVNTIIANNKTIIANNLLCARYAEKLTTDQKNLVRDLQYRLEQRNKALIDSGTCNGLTQSYPAGYAELQPYLDALMSDSSGHVSLSDTNQGVGSVTVTIIVTAIVIASLSTAAYFAYKAYAAQSEQDVKYSKELTKILTEKLTPEEYQQLMSETKGIVTKARIWQSIGNYGRLITFAAVGVGAFFLYKLFTNNGKES